MEAKERNGAFNMAADMTRFEAQSMKSVEVRGMQDVAAAWDADDGYGGWDAKVRIPTAIKRFRDRPF